MALSLKGFALAFGVIWGGAIFFTGLIHLVAPPFATTFLHGVSSIYPGFHGASNPGDLLIGTAYALTDGALGGTIFAWLYNKFAGV